MNKVICATVCLCVISCGHIVRLEKIDPINPYSMVVVLKTTPIEKNFTRKENAVEIPRYCKFFGGVIGGITDTISCSIIDIRNSLSDKTVQYSETVNKILLNNGMTIYSKSTFSPGDKVMYKDIWQYQE
jgi:hypothetical protein